MDNLARKYHPRAPRYVLRPRDRQTMRFSLQHAVGPSAIEETLLLNLSETGAAFVIPRAEGFQLGDIIKVEIPIPNGDQIAWFGRVVRMEEFEPRGWGGADAFRESPRLLVGLRFEDLPEPHTRAIRKGIESSLMLAMREQQYRTWVYYKIRFFQNIFKILGYLALTAAAVWFIWYFSQPSDNYDSKRGAPWGERFKF